MLWVFEAALFAGACVAEQSAAPFPTQHPAAAGGIPADFPGSALDASHYWLPAGRLYATLEALLATLTNGAVVTDLARLAGIDPVVMPLPASLDFRTGRDVADLLQPVGLKPIPGAGPSRGASLLANPALDLGDPQEREVLVGDWLQQIALDARLSGMESLLAADH